jgi:hypothetical protein
LFGRQVPEELVKVIEMGHVAVIHFSDGHAQLEELNESAPADAHASADVVSSDEDITVDSTFEIPLSYSQKPGHAESEEFFTVCISLYRFAELIQDELSISKGHQFYRTISDRIKHPPHNHDP